MNSSFALTRKLVACTVGVGLLCTALTASLAFAANPPLTATFSSTAPTQPASTGQNPIPATLSFSEGTTNFTQSDITVANGSVTNLVITSDSVVTFGIIPTASGSVSVDLSAGIVTGTDGQTNQAAPELQFIYDPNASDAPGNTASTTTTTSTSTSTSGDTPTVAFTGGPADGSTIATSTATFTFSVTPADATAGCLFGDATSPYACGSPQTFSGLPVGTYPFTVIATNADGTASTSVTTTFTVNFDAPVVTEVTPVPTPSNDTVPSYTFASTEAGNITLGGGCSTNTTSTDATTTTITFNTLAPATYNCTLTVTDAGGNVSNTLNITPFIINGPAPVASSGGGGGGGGGGMIVGSGPLAPGYVNTNPQPNLVATAAPAPVAVTPVPEPTVVTIANTPSTVGSSRTVTTVTRSAPAPAPAGGVTPIVTISSSSSSTSTPGVPNTGEPAQTAAVTTSGTAIPLWVWIVLLIVVVVGGGVWMFSSEF